MANNYLDYYGNHDISPVRQDISNIDIHYRRREKLYRQCGIPVIAFKDKDVLEIGPGGGYNTLALFQWDIKHADLVEPNKKGREDMWKLFTEQGISVEKYHIYSCMIENYTTTKTYDIIIAEGFLYAVDNKREIINRCKSLMAKHGIIVVTCSDHMCCFIELMKRLLGHIIVKDVDLYDDKVEYLVSFFAPQLSKLKGVSRSPREWVQDQILNPAFLNMDFSMSQAIDYFGDEYDILGTSPNIFTDYSWYKDIWFDYKDDYKKQFARKRASMLMAGMPEKILSPKAINNMESFFDVINDLEIRYEQTLNERYVLDIRKCICKMRNSLLPVGSNFMKVYDEIDEALSEALEYGAVNLEKYPHFFSAFGRTQQYIAFVKE